MCTNTPTINVNFILYYANNLFLKTNKIFLLVFIEDNFTGKELKHVLI